MGSWLVRAVLALKDLNDCLAVDGLVVFAVGLKSGCPHELALVWYDVNFFRSAASNVAVLAFPCVYSDDAFGTFGGDLKHLSIVMRC